MTPVELPYPLVPARWLLANLSRFRVIDVRWYLDGRVGREAYEAGHIPGAIHLDIDRDLSAPRGPGRPGRHPLPEVDEFKKTLQSAGLTGATPIVVYDDEGGAIAARFWWMLRYFGHPAQVMLLDGGYPSWLAEGGAIEVGAQIPKASSEPLNLELHPTLYVDRQYVQSMMDQQRGILLDARSLPRYRGDSEPIDPRAGHIPGARSAPFVENLVEARGRFLDPATLRSRYKALGVYEGVEVVVYCGSGVTACHNLLALELSGLTGRLYGGSWSDWSSDPLLPARLGSDP